MASRGSRSIAGNPDLSPSAVTVDPGTVPGLEGKTHESQGEQDSCRPIGVGVHSCTPAGDPCGSCYSTGCPTVRSGSPGLCALSSQQAWLSRNGHVIYGPVHVATGKSSFPTDPGIFRAFWKDLHHRSSEFHNAPMPYSVFFNRDDAFHEDDTTIRSHGCVHLNHRAAQIFYNTLQAGDVVQVSP